jgi:hypothetical protein
MKHMPCANNTICQLQGGTVRITTKLSSEVEQLMIHDHCAVRAFGLAPLYISLPTPDTHAARIDDQSGLKVVIEGRLSGGVCLNGLSLQNAEDAFFIAEDCGMFCVHVDLIIIIITDHITAPMCITNSNDSSPLIG